MAHVEAIRQERRGRTAVEMRSSAAVAILVAVMAAVVVAEVFAGRTATTGERPRESSWAQALRIGDAASARGDASSARRAYLSALFRARGEHSLPGVLDAAERFTALGDREVVRRAISMAAALGGDAGDADSQRRLQALRDELRASEAPPLTVSAPR
jgi:hypothetical protein